MHKNTMKCNETLSKWCKNKHGASKIIDTFWTYQVAAESTDETDGAAIQGPVQAGYPQWGRRRPVAQATTQLSVVLGYSAAQLVNVSPGQLF
jgi:hypothetical protein